MGKRRKSTGSGLKNASQQISEGKEQTKYRLNEDFADSEDEFFAGRDKILLEDGPSSKRRKVDKDGN
jgi:U3 small nucleolar RNA-associated protein 3